MSNQNPSLPEYVKVGPYTWSVLDDAEEINRVGHQLRMGLYGVTEVESQKVIIHPGMEPDIEADTVLHELLHVVVHVAGANISNKKEEKLIRSISATLLQVIRDNPKLIEYFQGVE